jgi:O-antigen/teichoic acid export membrane protein
MNLTADVQPVASVSLNKPRRADHTGRELKRGAALNAVASLASNFRAVFTLLIARLLGPAALGIFSVAWATTDLLSKIGIVGLDDAATTFVARAEAIGDRQRSRLYLRIANLIAFVQSSIVAALLSFGMSFIADQIRLDPQMTSALRVIVWALPGIALYRTSTSVSRGAKVMQHDIYSRGLTEPAASTIAFLTALALGAGTFAPELAAVIGSFASGLIAVLLAYRLLRERVVARQIGVMHEAKTLLAYALPIGTDQFLNAFIWRIDVIILGCFVGRAPGVTLSTVGIYGAVVGLANGLRRVSQPFTPIFAPIVAGMTATGARDQAAATYSRLLRWMLWILMPVTAAMILAGPTILLVYGRQFQEGAQWLTIVAVACATNAWINLGETVIMVQRPGLNLLNSLITCLTGIAVTVVLVSYFGVIGAALGILITYGVQGLIRTIILHFVFHWPNPWQEVLPLIIVGVVAIGPAAICRFMFPGTAGQLVAALICLGVFAAAWLRERRRLVPIR